MESLQKQPSDISCVICFGEVKTKNIASSAEELNKVFDNCVKFLENLIVIEPFENEAGLVFCDLCWDFELNTAKFTEHISSLQKKVLNLRLAFSAGVTHRRNQFLEGKKRAVEITGGRESIRESNDASILQTDPSPTTPTATNIQNVQQVVESPSADIPLSETLIESVKESQSIDHVIQEAHPENVENSLADPEPASSENEDVITNNSDLMKTVKLPFILLNRISLDATKKRSESLNEAVKERQSIDNSFEEPNPGNIGNTASDSEVAINKNEVVITNNLDLMQTVNIPFILLKEVSLDTTTKRKEIVCGNSCESNPRMKTIDTKNDGYQPNSGPRRSKYRGIQLNRAVSQKSLFKCSKCQSTFPFQSVLNLHLKMHCKQKTRQCTTTKRTVQRRNQKEINREKRLKKLSCSFCQKLFNPSYLKMHEKQHTGKGKYKCETCKKLFFCKSRLRWHEQIHSNVRPYKCEVCDRAFRRKYDLRGHELIHTDLHLKKQYKCETCQKTFGWKSSLKLHQVIHTKVRAYKCAVCGKAFVRKSSLTVHAIIHSNLKQYECEICKKTFRRKLELERHETIHREDSGQKCSFCNATYSSTRGLTLHEKIHRYGSEYTCEFCQKKFSRVKYFDIHIRSHTKEKPYKCSFCEKAFSCRQYVKFHERIHSEQYHYECSFCKRGFKFATSFYNHIRRHVGERPFICVVCKQEFTTSGQLKKHKKIHATETQGNAVQLL